MKKDNTPKELKDIDKLECIWGENGLYLASIYNNKEELGKDERYL